MNIVFLGTSTDDKGYFILCLAKILSAYKKVIIYSKRPYPFEEENVETCEYCGIEICHFSPKDGIEPAMDEETINLIDLDEYMPLEMEFTPVAVCDPSRRCLEQSVKLSGQYMQSGEPSDIQVVFLNLMEYCKVGEKYMSLFWEKSLPEEAKISHVYPVYFEEVDRVVMIESQYFEKLPIRDLTRTYKTVLIKLISNLLGIDGKKAKRLLKQAERMK